MSLEIKNLVAGYDNKSIIRNFSFQIPENSLTVLLGLNGSGKSTLLKCISCAIPYQGSISIQNHEISTTTPKALAGLVSSVLQINPNGLGLTCLQVVITAAFHKLRTFQVFSATLEKEALKTMELCGCLQWAYCPIDELSGGERQLIWLAQAEFQQTDCVLLDEPSHFLDWYQKKLLKDRLKQWLIDGKSLIIATHDLDCIPQHDGQIIYFSPHGLETFKLNNENLEGVKSKITNHKN